MFSGEPQSALCWNTCTCNSWTRSETTTTSVPSELSCLSALWVEREILHVIIWIKNTKLKGFNRSSSSCIPQSEKKRKPPEAMLFRGWQPSEFIHNHLQTYNQPFTAMKAQTQICANYFNWILSCSQKGCGIHRCGRCHGAWIICDTSRNGRNCSKKPSFCYIRKEASKEGKKWGRVVLFIWMFESKEV